LLDNTNAVGLDNHNEEIHNNVATVLLPEIMVSMPSPLTPSENHHHHHYHYHHHHKEDVMNVTNANEHTATAALASDDEDGSCDSTCNDSADGIISAPGVYCFRQYFFLEFC